MRNCEFFLFGSQYGLSLPQEEPSSNDDCLCPDIKTGAFCKACSSRSFANACNSYADGLGLFSCAIMSKRVDSKSTLPFSARSLSTKKGYHAFHRPVSRSSVKLLKITDLCLNPLYVIPLVLVTRPSTPRTASTREPRTPFVYGCKTCGKKRKSKDKKSS